MSIEDHPFALGGLLCTPGKLPVDAAEKAVTLL